MTFLIPIAASVAGSLATAALSKGGGGSKPSVSSFSNSVLNPQQQEIGTLLSQILQSGNLPTVSPQYTGQLTPNEPGLTSSTLSALSNILSMNGYQAPPTSTQGATTAAGTLTNLLQGNVPQIDPSQTIQSSIVAPLMQQYQQTILPSIMGKFGQSAGSAFSSDQLDARQEAANNLETNIASAAGQLGLGAAEANQSATLGGMESGLFDAPSTLGLPQALTGAGQSLLSNLLQNSLTPYNIASASDTASYQNYLNQQKQSMNLLQTMLGYSTAPTMQTNQVVNSGQASLLSTILGNPGVGQGIGSLLSSAFGSSGGSSAAASGVGSAISSAGSLLSSFFQ